MFTTHFSDTEIEAQRPALPVYVPAIDDRNPKHAMSPPSAPDTLAYGK